MRYLNAHDILGLTAPQTLIAALEQGLQDFAHGKVQVPVRAHIDFGDNTLLTMPVISPEVFGVKVVSVVPSNAGRNLATIQGLMTLHDGVTGVPLAVLDAAAVTSQRTGAIGAIALRYTTPPSTDCIGIIGVGVQALWQAVFACAVRPIHTVHFLARSDETAKNFKARVEMLVPAVRLVRSRDVQELLQATSVVITATTSSTPVLPETSTQLVNKHFVSVGSFKPSMQELPDAVYRLAGHVVIDSEAARHEVGDVIEPLSAGLIETENVLHLADLVTGSRTVDTAKTTVVKSVGMALYDLYAARTFVAEALRLNRGTQLDS